MDAQIKEIINIIATDIKKKLPQDIEKKYYDKMCYSNVSIISEIESGLLYENISFEIAFIHTITYIFVISLGLPYSIYYCLIEKLDVEYLFSWYKIDEGVIIEAFSRIDFKEYEDIYSFINLHDTLIEKDIKKKFGQFYTPINIVKKMIDEIKLDKKKVTMQEKVIDPACGTGVFLVETLRALDNQFHLEEKLEYVSKNIYAYDVNPFAILATKLNLIYALISKNKNKSHVIIKFILQSKEVFKNIQWKNTIVEEDSNKYDIILGNPPYFKLNNKLIKNLESYKEVSYGQPNIYSFFMFWAIEHLNKDGKMCFIVPQSIRSGLYFKSLRAKIFNFRVKTIINIDSRQNVFDRADQAVLIICIENKKVSNTKTAIQFYDGNGKISSQIKIKQSRLMMNESCNNIFIIAKRIEMYDILEKVYKNNNRLDLDCEKYKFSNGLFVWNQHKGDIVDSKENTIPIIYGGNVQTLHFDFQQCPSNSEKKHYSKVNEETQRFALSGKRLLVQRTTNFDKKIRIKSCLISNEFLLQYDKYFLENHVNFLCYKSDKNKIINEEVLYYFLGILNSKLLNYIFISKSGNTQVSANELNSLPFPNVNYSQIAQFVKEHSSDMQQYQDEFDMLVCNAYGLSESETEFIIKY